MHFEDYQLFFQYASSFSFFQFCHRVKIWLRKYINISKILSHFFLVSPKTVSVEQNLPLCDTGMQTQQSFCKVAGPDSFFGLKEFLD